MKQKHVFLAILSISVSTAILLISSLWIKTQLLVPADESNASEIVFSLDKPFFLRQHQMAYYPSVEYPKITLKITDFVNSPCPKGARCIWSGLAVNLEMVIDGKVYKSPGNIIEAPYKVEIVDSDYETYAKLKVFPDPRKKALPQGQ